MRITIPRNPFISGGLAQTVAVYRLRSPEGTLYDGFQAEGHSLSWPRKADEFRSAESQTPKNGVCASQPRNPFISGGLAQTVAVHRLRSPEGTLYDGFQAEGHSSSWPRRADEFRSAESQTPKNGV